MPRHSSGNTEIEFNDMIPPVTYNDYCIDQDLLENEILQPFVTSRGNEIEDCYYSDAFQTLVPPEPEKVSSAPVIPTPHSVRKAMQRQVE